MNRFSRTVMMLAAAAAVAAPAAAQTAAKPKGDPVKGKVDFVACKACHSPDKGVNRVGPSLWGIVGRKSGTIPAFRYSPANKKANVTWTPDVLFTYLAAPRKFMPGTYMSYAGLTDPQKRANVIAYLGTLK